MLQDTQLIKERTDLRQIVEQDLGQPAIRSGRASVYKCPFHQEKKGYSLAVWHDGYRCFGKCDVSGDLFDWLMNYRHLSFPEAITTIGENRTIQDYQPPKILTHSPMSEPPDENWQRSARQVVEMAENILWSAEGECALNYLLGRGLTSQTIRTARLGYIPGNFDEWREIEGLNVPCGITIPWFASGTLWAVKIRRAYGAPKYVQIAGGSSHGLYNADALLGSNVALFCEGEFDALLVQQEAGHLISAVTLGSATARLTARWHNDLMHLRMLFVTYDRDPAGKRGTEHLLQISSRFRELPLPHGKDITGFYLNDGDIYSWIEKAISSK